MDARRSSRASVAWSVGWWRSATSARARSPRWWWRTARTSRQRPGRRPLAVAAAREEDQDGHGPEPADEPEQRPEVLRVPVVVGEETAHDRLADVEREGSAEHRRPIQVGRDEAQPAQVPDDGRQVHRASWRPRRKPIDAR